VPDADSKPRFHSSPVETVPFIARTVFRRARPAALAAAATGVVAAAALAAAGAVKKLRFEQRG